MPAAPGSRTAPVRKAALAAHLFLRGRDLTGTEPGGAANPVRAHLDTWWNACGRLGMDDALSPWPREPSGISLDGSFDGPRILAARHMAAPEPHDGARAFRVGLLYAWYDIVGVSVLLAPNDDATDWRSLRDAWFDVTGNAATDGPGTVGSALVLLGEVPDAPVGSSEPAAISARLAPLVPDVPASARWADAPPRRAGRGRKVFVWELPQEGAARTSPHRRLLAVTSQSTASELSHWAWQGDDPGASPSVRYLLQAARLRFQYALLWSELPAVHALGERVDASSDRLLALLRSSEGGAGRDADESAVLEAENELTDIRSGEAGVLHSLARVRIMQAMFKAASHSLESDSSNAALAAVDLRMSHHAGEQLQAVETSLASSAERAADVGARAEQMVERGHRERRDRLTIVQTSVLGALIMALTATQSLQYKVRLPGHVTPAVIAALATAALILPSLLLPRRESSALRARGRLTDSAFFAAAGAAAGWLTATGVAAALGRHAPLPVTLAAVCCMAAGAVGLRSFMVRRHR